EHEGGYLPFQFEISRLVTRGKKNQLVIKVNNTLTPDTVPQGGLKVPQEQEWLRNYPPTSFDFFPYGGIHRPVVLYATPKSYLQDIIVKTDIENDTGRISWTLQTGGEEIGEASVTLMDDERVLVQETTSRSQGELELKGARLWSPDDPFLYRLEIKLLQKRRVVDRYTLPIGIRTIRVEGDELLLNEQPIYLRGFGMHEDFPVIGKGLNPPLIVKDYSLLRWIGANSFRTSHYPYSEEMMQLADKYGFLVIDEVPAVGINPQQATKRTLEVHKQQMRELVERDRNHPSVIMWSVGNEPQANTEEADRYFKEVADLARKLDDTRPITVVSWMIDDDRIFKHFDVVCVNRYHGWYDRHGQLNAAVEHLRSELEKLYRFQRKPIIVSEFGADSVAGLHSDPPEMFTEEYQAEFIRRYLEVFRKLSYIVGEHIWNFADFKTSQGIHRVFLNRKGVFTRDRQPKLAAHVLKKLWTGAIGRVKGRERRAI
ncbi:beta-glucuronidase, partial [candidate division KSB1 bacterium]